MKKLNHLAEIYKSYDTFVVDLWGVMHNGVKLNSKAIEAISNLIQNEKKVVFLTKIELKLIHIWCLLLIIKNNNNNNNKGII